MVDSEIIQILPKRFREYFEQAEICLDRLREIRLRIGQPVELREEKKRILCREKVDRSDIREMLEYISGYSLYAFEEEISQGFITVPGGHRVGVAGQVVMEQGNVKNIRNISFINVRLSHQETGFTTRSSSLRRAAERQPFSGISYGGCPGRAMSRKEKM